ncbi:MAG: type IV pilus assembly protein PilM [Clostridiales bacterium]
MLSSGCVAVDIGKRNIKLVYGKINKQKIEIINFDIFKTPENSVQDGKIVDLSSIINCLRLSYKRKNINSKNLKLSISGTSIITRDIKIPKVEEKEIESILDFEAPQYFPVSLDDYVLDYKIIEETSDDEGNFYRLLLVAVPNNLVNDYMQIPKILKMDIKSIDIPANSIYKYMSFGRISKEEKTELGEYAVIDFGANTTSVCIFSKGTLMFNRILLKGSKELDETISNTMNVDYELGENLKCKKLVLSEDNNIENVDQEAKQLNEIVKPTIMSQTDDINRFLDFYNSRMYGNRISKIFICGGGSKINGMDKFLSSYMNLPVESIKYDDRIINKNKRESDIFEQKFPYLINAIGTIL